MTAPLPHRRWLSVAALGAALLAVLTPRAVASPTVIDVIDEATRSSFGEPPFREWDEATEKVYQREAGHADYPAEIHYDLGLYFFEMGEYDLSLKHYRRAAEIAPEFSEAYFGMGLLFYTLGDDENAVHCYQRSLVHNPNDADTRNNLGLIYYRKGQLGDARDQILEAVRLQPEFADAHYNLGLVYYQQEDPQTAMTHFLTALNQEPGYLRARFNLGVVYFELGLLEKAAEQWSKIQEMAPGTPLATQAAENLSVLREGE